LDHDRILETVAVNVSMPYLGMLYGDYNKVEYTYIDEKPAIARAALANLDHE